MSRIKRTSFDKKLLDHITYGQNIEAKSMLNPELAQARDAFGSLLHHSVFDKNKVITRYLLELGADVDCLGSGGKTPLMLAVRRGYAPIVRILLEANANIDVVDDKKISALHRVFDKHFFDLEVIGEFFRKIQAETGTTDKLVERLIAAGCSMYHAAHFSDINLMKCMLEHGIDINSKGINELTALVVAIDENDLNLTKWLISNGADVNALDHNGTGALEFAVLNGNKDMIEILLEHGANPNCKDDVREYTPLFAVFEHTREQVGEEYVGCAELLLQYGAIPRNSLIRKATIFDYALRGSSDKGAKVLIAHLAMLEMLGTRITESVMHCTKARNQSKMPEFKNFHALCQQVLAIRMFDKLSLLDLLNKNETNMRLLVRMETFVSEVEKVCSELKLSELYSYYYNTLMKRIAKASRVVKLEDEAIPVICKIFDGKYNQCYNFARNVVSYLKERDLEQLVQV